MALVQFTFGFSVTGLIAFGVLALQLWRKVRSLQATVKILEKQLDQEVQRSRVLLLKSGSSEPKRTGGR
jgi:hypothetical protein